MHDTKAGLFVALGAYRKYSTIKAISGDGSYRGSFVNNLKNILDIKVDISPKIKAEGFHIIPNRWIVERTFGWLNNSRRLAKDFEITVSSQESMIKISHFHTLIKRL